MAFSTDVRRIPLVQPAYRRLRRLFPGKPKKRFLDFASRHSNFSKRNDLVLKSLPPSPAWILDVGSNLGDTSNFLAKRGYYVLGVESGKEEWLRAKQKCEAGAAFMNVSVSAEFLDSGRDWDAILLLSVLHRIYAFEGADTMKGVLTACSHRTQNIVIEGSTRHARYTDKGQGAPNFCDLNVQSAKEWHETIFESTLNKSWRVVSSERLTCSAAEPERLFFHLQSS